MYRVLQRPDLDDAVDQAAKPRCQAGHARPPVGRVRQNDHVGAQVLPVPLEERLEVRRAHLLLTFDEDLDPNRWLRAVREER
jgi:hypothetical protein